LLLCALFVATSPFQASDGISLLQEGYLRYATQSLYECEFEASIEWVDESLSYAPTDLAGFDDRRNLIFAIVVRAAALQFLGRTEESESTLQSVEAVSSEESMVAFRDWISDAETETEECRRER